MTKTTLLKIKSRCMAKIFPYLTLLIALIMMLGGGHLKEGVKYGLGLSFNNIIPTLFPFFILSDFWSCNFVFIKENKKYSSINPYYLNAFISGAICGFPIGIKTAVSLYKHSAINKKELERLIGAVNIPSFAFVVFGVGAGLHGDVILGIYLYFTLLISSAILLVFFNRNTHNNAKAKEISRQSFNLVESIKNAAISSITVSSYVVFFSSLLFLFRSMHTSPALNVAFSSILEVSNAVSIIANNKNWLGSFAPVVTAFALGFSGFSVHLQAFALLPKETAKGYYLLMKLLQGILCSAIVLAYTLIKKG